MLVKPFFETWTVYLELLEFWTLSLIRNLKTRKCFGNWMFPSSGEERKTPTLLGPLGRANPDHWATCHITKAV
jgi:hypothetical protein